MPYLAGRDPDFALLADDFGLLILEAKGWYAGQIARANPEEVELHRNDDGQTRVGVHKHPTRQAREYAFALINELARPDYAILRQPDGEHRGKPCVPVGYGVVLTNIARAQLDEAGLAPLFPPKRAICRDELATLESAGDRAVIERLRALFSNYFLFDPLTEDQQRTLKGALHKEVVIRKRPATPASVPAGRMPQPGAVVLDVLDAQQEQAARSLGDGPGSSSGSPARARRSCCWPGPGCLPTLPRVGGSWSSASSRPWPPTWPTSYRAIPACAGSRYATSTPGSLD